MRDGKSVASIDFVHDESSLSPILPPLLLSSVTPTLDPPASAASENPTGNAAPAAPGSETVLPPPTSHDNPSPAARSANPPLRPRSVRRRPQAARQMSNLPEATPARPCRIGVRSKSVRRSDETSSLGEILCMMSIEQKPGDELRGKRPYENRRRSRSTPSAGAVGHSPQPGRPPRADEPPAEVPVRLNAGETYVITDVGTCNTCRTSAR